MANAPGFFHMIPVDGPSESVPLWNWVLTDAAGDVVAESFVSMSRTSAERIAQWIIDNGASFEIAKPPRARPTPRTRQ